MYLTIQQHGDKSKHTKKHCITNEKRRSKYSQKKQAKSHCLKYQTISKKFTIKSKQQFLIKNKSNITNSIKKKK